MTYGGRRDGAGQRIHRLALTNDRGQLGSGSAVLLHWLPGGVLDLVRRLGDFYRQP